MTKNVVGSFAPEMVAAIGKAVGAFILSNGIKSEYVRIASGFNAARFAPFKRVS